MYNRFNKLILTFYSGKSVHVQNMISNTVYGVNWRLNCVKEFLLLLHFLHFLDCEWHICRQSKIIWIEGFSTAQQNRLRINICHRTKSLSLYVCCHPTWMLLKFKGFYWQTILDIIFVNFIFCNIWKLLQKIDHHKKNWTYWNT